MKRVIVNTWQKALVYKNNEFRRVLNAGNYWIWNEKVTVVDIREQLDQFANLELLARNSSLHEVLQFIEVGDQKIVLQLENGNLKAVLTTGLYAFWKEYAGYTFVEANLSETFIREDISRVILQNRMLAAFVRTSNIENYEAALLFVDGKFEGKLAAGLHYWWKNEKSVQIVRADVRMQQLEINGQEILTKDKAALRINAWAQFRVADIEKAVLQNAAYDKQLYILLQLALRSVVATLGFDELLEKRERLSDMMLDQLREHATALGVEIANFGIRDIILSGEVRAIMNEVLVADKKAQA
ncbi:MAG: hypothetical protein RLY16_1280, partial [Bacteroidota bacterium]